MKLLSLDLILIMKILFTINAMSFFLSYICIFLNFIQNAILENMIQNGVEFIIVSDNISCLFPL